MEIIHVCQFLGVGGLEKVLYLLIKEQLKNNHQVTLIVYDWEKTWVEKFRQAGIEVLDDYTKSPGYDTKLINYLNKHIQRVDIIHTHDLNPMLYIGPLKMIRKITLKGMPRIVHTTHGMEHIDLRPKTRFYEKFLSLTADAIVGVSPSICNYYLNRTFATKKNIFNIDNGTPINATLSQIDKSKYKLSLAKSFGLDIDKKIYIYVARVVPLKGQELLIAAFSKQSDKQLLLVGPSGNDDYWNQINGVKFDNIHIVGSQENIDEILLGCDVYISASHHEGIPIAVLEAASCGLPCILTNISGHKTLSKNSSQSKPVTIFFEVENLESLENAILQSNNQLEMDKLRINMHKIVYDNYSSNRMCIEYEKVYKANK